MSTMVFSLVRYSASDTTVIVSAKLPDEDMEEVLFDILGCRPQTRGGKNTSRLALDTLSSN